MGMFAGIVLLMGFTPIGLIPLPFIKLTILHIPVIIGSVLLGPKHGAVLGFLFGLCSLINNTYIPAVSSFAFSPAIPVPGTDGGSPWALVICFGPRILVGVTPWLTYKGLQKLTRGGFKFPCLAAAGVVGSMTNTLLVMHLIYFLFREAYASVREIRMDEVYGVILGIISFNGLCEAAAAAILVAAVCGVTLGMAAPGRTTAPERRQPPT